MFARSLGITLGLLFWMPIASAQTVNLPPQTTGLTPIAGKITQVQTIRVPRPRASTRSETQISFQFTLQGCLDTLLPLISQSEVRGKQVTLYITALNAHNEGSKTARCFAIPQASAQVTIPGAFQPEHIQVVFLGQSSEASGR